MADTNDSQPPSKRRKLSLSEIPLVLDAEEESQQKETPLQWLPRGEKEFSDGQPQEEDLFLSRDLDDEDTQIQCSLPLYLNHVFGSAQGRGSQLVPLTIEEHTEPLLTSQGFLVTTSPPPAGTSPREKGREESSISPVLFASPASLNNDVTDCDKRACSSAMGNKEDTTTVTVVSALKKIDTPEHSKDGDVRMRLVSDALQGKDTRKRRRSLTIGNTISKGYKCPPTCTRFTDCTEPEWLVSLFGIALQVNPVMEVACKKGSMAGQTVQMSSLLLGDPTKSYFKLSLWREAARWVERVAAGDMLYFTNIKLKTWLKEIVGHTMMRSTVLNLHQPKKGLPPKVRETVPISSLESLKQWAMMRHGYLFEGASLTPKSQRKVHFKTSQELGVDSVVHFRGKLLAVVSSRVVLIADEPGKEAHLYLLSINASLWHNQLSSGVGQVWEFLYVAVAVEGTQAGCYSLQTTSRSELRRLKSNCEIADDILKKFSSSGSYCFITQGFTFREIIDCKECGTFECKAVVVSFGFSVPDGSRLLLNSLLQLSSLELVSQLCQAVYVGCESCSKPLEQDANGVYCQCLSCMARKPGGYPSSSYHFRPLLATLQDGSGCVEVMASHAVVSKVFSISAGVVLKASLSEDNTTCGKLKQSVEGVICAASSCSENNIWTIRCSFNKDENSFLQSLSMTLLDWKTP